MKTYDRFIFDSYAFNPAAGKIELRYSLDDEVHFTETLTLPVTTTYPLQPTPSLDRALFALHLIAGISYYKTCLPKTIEIRSGALREEQATFWNTVYEQGLGEFFYKNKIDGKGMIHFPVGKSDTEMQNAKCEMRNADAPRLLVPVGGGKDSAVTIELLRKAGFDMTLLRVGGHPLIDRFVEEARKPVLTVERHLSPALFDLNARGALNGHIPITGLLALLSVVLGELYGFTHTVFSNERSAEEGNVEVGGAMVNHQWSKSLAFERMLQEYLARFVTGNTTVFSLLRPLSELHIMQMFAQYPHYFDRFTSCNKNWKILSKEPPSPPGGGAGGGGADRWCGKCPKCAFSFALLSAFLPRKELLAIFGGDLFADAALLPLYRELLGIEGHKPFECVGTPEETAAALLLADERGEWDTAPVMEMFRAEALDRFPSADTMINALLIPSRDHAIPEAFRSALPS